MKYIPILRTRLLALAMVSCQLLSHESSAAYRVSNQTEARLNTSQTQRTSNLTGHITNPSVKDEVLTKFQHPDDGDRRRHRKLTDAGRALVFGLLAALSSLEGLSISHAVAGSINLSAMIGIGLYGIILPIGFGALAITQGIKALKAKKQKVLAIIGLILGILSLAAAIYIIV